MTEPTYENVCNAAEWWDKNKGTMRGKDGPQIYATYASHRTADLQAKIAKLEDDTTVLCTSVLRYRDRIATLEAELAARDFVPIGDEHREGHRWQVGARLGDTWLEYKAFFDSDYGLWKDAQTYAVLAWLPTHAAPLPKPPAKEGE